MVSVTCISLIVGYILILCLSSITIIHIIRYRKKYGTEFIAFLNLSIVFISGIGVSSLYIFSVVFFINNQINMILWKLSIISGCVSLIITSFIYSFFKEYRKIQIIPVSFTTILFGLLMGNLIFSDSIQIIITSPTPLPFTNFEVSLINYNFSFITGLIIIIFQVSITLYLLFISIYINLRTKKIEVSLPLFINTIIFSIPIASFILYIIFQDSFFRELFITLIWITNFGVDIMLIKKPEMFFVLPNKIFSISLFHKSGILLYTYNFEKKSEFIEDSTIWGKIIIGLNHVLSEFVDQEDKIDVLQTKNADIVVNYDNNYGYAVVVITNKKNAILEKLIYKLTEDFNSVYKNELMDIQDLNKIINVSEFKNTKEIIEKNFQLYL